MTKRKIVVVTSGGRNKDSLVRSVGRILCGLTTAEYVATVTTGRVVAHKGDGWCSVEFRSSPSGRTLYAAGYFWGGDYDSRLYDLTDPITSLEKLAEARSLSRFVEWSGPDAAIVGSDVEMCVCSGKPVWETPNEVLEDCDAKIAAGEKEEEHYRTETIYKTVIAP